MLFNLFKTLPYLFTEQRKCQKQTLNNVTYDWLSSWSGFLVCTTSFCAHFENDQKWSNCYRSDQPIFETKIDPIKNPCGTLLETDSNFDQQQGNASKRNRKLSNRSLQISWITLLLTHSTLQKLMYSWIPFHSFIYAILRYSDIYKYPFTLSYM